MLHAYLQRGYTYSNIQDISEKFGSDLSFRQIQRIVTRLGLKKKIDEDFDQIFFSIVKELERSRSCLGYKAMWNRLKQLYGLSVCRQTVLELLQILDTEAVEQRAKYRLKNECAGLSVLTFCGIWMDTINLFHLGFSFMQQ